ncbi:MAG TPA: ribosome-recycling factor [Candidatus Andersenbacteria bacterium]|nr:ribosome-recycling factor [Candidatus Andersenbacteria bacterium]
MSLQQAEELFNESSVEALGWFESEIAGLRSGRVKPAIIEDITVEVYGSRTPIKGVASVSNMDARTLVVSPWDKSTIAAIEKAIIEANVGVMPTIDGAVLRLSFQSLTEEVRLQTIKALHAKAEEARIRMRKGRDEALKYLKNEKEAGKLSEDEFYGGKKRLDELISKAQDELQERVDCKEEEIKTI